MQQKLFTRIPQKMSAQFADFLKECYLEEGVLELCEVQTNGNAKVWGYYLPAIQKIVWDSSWTIDEPIAEINEDELEDFMKMNARELLYYESEVAGDEELNAFKEMMELPIEGCSCHFDLLKDSAYERISMESLNDIVTRLVPQLYAEWIKANVVDNKRGYQIWKLLGIYDEELRDVENYLIEDSHYFYYFHFNGLEKPGDKDVVFTHYCNDDSKEPPRCFSLEKCDFADWSPRIGSKPIVKFVMNKGVPGYAFKGIYVSDSVNSNGNIELKSI